MFKSHHTSATHKCINLPKNTCLTCEIINIEYLIECTKCGKQYIGETGRAFRQRMYEHIASVKNHLTPQSQNIFTQTTTLMHMRFCVIQWLGSKTNPKTQNLRRAKEMAFIWDVLTINPIGINQFV